MCFSSFCPCVYSLIFDLGMQRPIRHTSCSQRAHRVVGTVDKISRRFFDTVLLLESRLALTMRIWQTRCSAKFGSRPCRSVVSSSFLSQSPEPPGRKSDHSAEWATWRPGRRMGWMRHLAEPSLPVIPTKCRHATEAVWTFQRRPAADCLLPRDPWTPCGVNNSCSKACLNSCPITS